MKKDVEKMMDLNDDGKVDWSDAEQAKESLMSIIGYNLPSGSGFGAGFAGGFRSGQRQKIQSTRVVDDYHTGKM